MSSDVPPARIGRSRQWIVWLILAVLVVAALVAGVLFMQARGMAGASPTSSATPSRPVASASPTPTPGTTELASGEIPATCAEIYMKDWAPEMKPLVLNPEWTESGKTTREGSRDDQLIADLAATTRLTCIWAMPGGPNDVAHLATNVAAVTDDQKTAALARMSAAGFTCYDELEGTRCVTETAPSADGVAGESHFVRDGVWVATSWLNAQPDGYTHDIVAAIFGS
ncbi:hypothetical protein WDJ51_07015 [Rathayibacter sp. YIM 133350]|uniref:hypothetical protein n=1 Tax=Rathayibacter sp. YIM 133350 TaxID=3131992 RepID=UPI00307DB954